MWTAAELWKSCSPPLWQREEKDMRVVNFGSLNIDYVYRVDHFVQPERP